MLISFFAPYQIWEILEGYVVWRHFIFQSLLSVWTNTVDQIWEILQGELVWRHCVATLCICLSPPHPPLPLLPKLECEIYSVGMDKYSWPNLRNTARRIGLEAFAYSTTLCIWRITPLTLHYPLLSAEVRNILSRPGQIQLTKFETYYEEKWLAGICVFYNIMHLPYHLLTLHYPCYPCRG